MESPAERPRTTKFREKVHTCRHFTAIQTRTVHVDFPHSGWPVRFLVRTNAVAAVAVPHENSAVHGRCEQQVALVVVLGAGDRALVAMQQNRPLHAHNARVSGSGDGREGPQIRCAPLQPRVIRRYAVGTPYPSQSTLRPFRMPYTTRTRPTHKKTQSGLAWDAWRSGAFTVLRVREQECWRASD